MLTSVSILLLCLGGDPVPAHKLTDLERAQRRMHAGDAELRKLRGELEGDIGRSGTGVVVIGKHNPELFFRWELMDRVSGYLRDEALFAKYVSQWDGRGAARHLGDDYLPRLQKVVAKLVAAENERQRLQVLLGSGKSTNTAETREEWSRVNQSICSLRAEALTAASAEFGREAFDRFLYEVVAPDATTFGVVGNTAESAVDTSRWIDGGCR